VSTDPITYTPPRRYRIRPRSAAPSGTSFTAGRPPSTVRRAFLGGSPQSSGNTKFTGHVAPPGERDGRTRLYTGASARLRAEHGLGLGQYEFLDFIDRTDDCRVLDLAAEMAITVGAVSKGVDRLVAAGWCERVAHPQDRRSSVLRLTEAGQHVLARSRPTLEDELAAAIGPADLARVAATLAALRETLEADRYGEPGRTA